MNPFEKFTLYTMTESPTALRERLPEIQRNLSARMGQQINSAIAERVQALAGIKMDDAGLRVRRHFDKEKQVWRAELDGQPIVLWTPGRFITQESKLWLEYGISTP